MASMLSQPRPGQTHVIDTPDERRAADVRHELPEALERCAAQIAAHLRHEAPATAMRNEVRTYSAHMRSLNIPPERTLSRLKQTILHVPEVSRCTAMERSEMVRELVQEAIRAYYAETPPGH